MTHLEVDLNADLGESFGRWTLGDDSGLLRIVTSANIACGFHAGDPATLVSTCRSAVERGVVIGAHVGYRDVPGFARRFIDIERGPGSGDCPTVKGDSTRRTDRDLGFAGRRTATHPDQV
jgi:lactam utilization protein B